MKQFVSSTSSLIIRPVLWIKNTRLNSFVSGLIFGAFFSLIVNIITVQVQETIQKQRILEAIENEILINLLQADNVLAYSQELIDEQTLPNFFDVPKKYTRDLWEQSTEPLQYIAQLDHDLQSKLMIFYTITIPSNNDLIDRISVLSDQKLKNCYFDEYLLTPLEKQECIENKNLFLSLQSKSAADIAEEGFDLLEIFHPTQERLNNPFLKLIMGDKSTRVLSGR